MIAASAFCFVLFNFYAITEAYLAHKVLMEVKMKHQRELLFPAVTICNMNPFRRSALQNNTPVAKRENQKVSRRHTAVKSRVRRATGELYLSSYRRVANWLLRHRKHATALVQSHDIILHLRPLVSSLV